MTRLSYILNSFDEAIHVSQDSGLLFKFSRLVTPSNLGVLGYLMLHSSSIEDAITKLCRYYALIGKSLKPIFFPNEGKLTLLICKDGSVSHLEKYSAEIHLSALLHLLNTIIPTPISPKKTTFRHAKPTHLQMSINIGYCRSAAHVGLLGRDPRGSWRAATRAACCVSRVRQGRDPVGGHPRAGPGHAHRFRATVPRR